MSTVEPRVSPLRTIVRGFFGRCPNCGKGRLFAGFLKVVDHCTECGEELHHQRADDFPAYCVIFLVGHLVVPLALAVEFRFSPPYWAHLALWLPLTLGLAIGLLQPVKGAIVAIQWMAGMHGFEEARRRRDSGVAFGARAPASTVIFPT